MNAREQQYFHGISTHKFDNTLQFSDFRNTLREIHEGSLRDGFYFEDKYEATQDLRPHAYDYDDSIIDVLIQDNIHQKMIDIFGYELFLCHVQIRISYKKDVRTAPYYDFYLSSWTRIPYNEDNLSYMPWHRDTYVDEDNKVVGPVPPMKKLIYYPKFNDVHNDCLMFALGSHLKTERTRQADVEQLHKAQILKMPNSVDDYVIFNTECMHHALPPTSDKQMRVIYSFCPIGQLEHHRDKGTYEKYMEKLNESLHSE